jgi:diaminopimelate decarboxylase
MTLADLLPSLRTFAAPANSPLAALAIEYGTPLHVLDEEVVRERCAAYVTAFGADAVSYSAKAGLNHGLARWVADSGLGVFASGCGAVNTAVSAGIPGERVTLTGARKSVEDLEAAFTHGSTVVARTNAEITALIDRAPHGLPVLLRVGSSAATSGFKLGSGATLAALGRIIRARNLTFAGLDFSIGHRLSRFGGYEGHVREAAAFCAVIQARFRTPVPALNLGGGYSDDFATAAFAARIRGVLALAVDRYGIVPPKLSVSPGRALVGPAGISIYRMLDDGTVNGPDCTCGGEHPATLIGRASRAPLRPMVLAGTPVMLPGDVGPGDLIAFAGTGAYHYDKGSAAVVSVWHNRARLMLPKRDIFE